MIPHITNVSNCYVVSFRTPLKKDHHPVAEQMICPVQSIATIPAYKRKPNSPKVPEKLTKPMNKAFCLMENSNRNRLSCH